MSFNQITLLGRLGKDPECRYTPTGKAVTSFSVATDENWTSADGTKNKKTTWFTVTAWGKLGEICTEYLKKGREVLVVGRMEPVHTWMVEGAEHVSKNLDVTASNVKFVGNRPEGAPTEASAEEATEEEQIPF